MKDMLKWILENQLAAIKCVLAHIFSYFFKEILEILGSFMKATHILPLFIKLIQKSNNLEGSLESIAAPTNLWD